MYAYRGKCAHCREQKIFILFFIFFKLFAKMVLQYEYSATFSNKYEAKFRKKMLRREVRWIQSKKFGDIFYYSLDICVSVKPLPEGH